MTIEDNLLQEENILAECEDKGFRFYATDKRLLKYKKGGLFNLEILHDISYNEISGITLEIKRGLFKVVVLGIFITVLGIGIYYFADFIGIYFDEYLAVVLSIVFIVCGIITIVVGTLYKKSGFQFKGPGLLSNEKEAEIWRLHDVEREDVRKFVKVVREEVAKREITR